MNSLRRYRFQKNLIRQFQLKSCVTPENFEKIQKFKEKKEQDQKERGRQTLAFVKERISNFKKGDFSPYTEKVPKYSEYLVIGGGIIGSAIAYSMKNRAPDSFELMVIERDPKYTRSSTALSVGGIRQQFSLEENIKLALYGSEFLRNVKEHLSVLDNEPPDIQFQPHGYLFLAGENEAEKMIRNHRRQIELGAKVELLNPHHLKQKFPWLNVEGVEMGSYGYENEGWFDPWALLSAFKRKASSLGATYVTGEVIGFEFENMSDQRGSEAIPQLQANYVYLKDETGEVHCVEFAFLVVAAGPYSAEIARMLNIGLGDGLLKMPLPIEPRKRYVYVFSCEDGPGLEMPLIIDPSGTYMRREGFGGKYICGRSPSPAEEPDAGTLEVDYNFFENSVLPFLSKRVPAFQSLQVSSAWSGYYDFNTFDQSPVFGLHPYFTNVYLATGFGGHGIQMAPAIGRAMMELLLDQCYVSVDLSRMHMDRLFDGKKLYEKLF